MLAQDFEPTDFALNLMLKDARYAAALAQSLGAPAGMIEGAARRSRARTPRGWAPRTSPLWSAEEGLRSMRAGGNEPRPDGERWPHGMPNGATRLTSFLSKRPSATARANARGPQRSDAGSERDDGTPLAFGTGRGRARAAQVLGQRVERRRSREAPRSGRAEPPAGRQAALVVRARVRSVQQSPDLCPSRFGARHHLSGSRARRRGDLRRRPHQRRRSDSSRRAVRKSRSRPSARCSPASPRSCATGGD